MKYRIDKAIGYRILATGKDEFSIKTEIIKAFGDDPNNSNHRQNLNNKIAGRTQGLKIEEFQAICKVCECPAYVLADTKE
jgi:hypothetical protein